VPVVATRLEEITRFVARHGDVVTLAEPETFAAAVEEAVADRDDGRKAHRIEAAAANGWDGRLREMVSAIDTALERSGGRT